MRSFDIGAVICEEDWEGYRDWTEALEYWIESDPGSIATPALDFETYGVSGQRQHLKLTIANSTGSTQTVKIKSQALGLGLWVPNTVLTTRDVTISMAYKATSGLAGSSVTAHASNSAFAGDVTAVATCDDTWRTVSGTWAMQDDSVLADGIHFIVSVPAGTSGTIRFDDFRIVRNSNIQRTIDSTCPVFPFRADWGAGFRETYGWTTVVERAFDGSEWRENQRIVPTCRLEFTVIAADAQTAGLIEQWLYRYHGAVVAVPRWADEVTLDGVTDSGHTVNVNEDLTTRWFQERQRFMLWASATNYEAEIIDTMNASRLTLDPGEGAVSGTFASDTTKVVPLIPARLVESIPIGRPNSVMGTYQLAFDVQMVQ